jgi:formiminotetrahydrofolate cyclodeaminase
MVEQPVEEFLAAMASESPTPGGGAAAALAGALGAALLSMVCHLTLGRERYASVEAEVAGWRDQAEELRLDLLALVEQDAAAYGELAAAYKLPRADDTTRADRARAIQEALIGATEVPMRIAECCTRVMDLCRPVAEHGNASVVSDAGVAVLLAEAALRGAMLSALVNLKAIKDLTFVDEQRRQLDSLLAGSADQREQVLRFVTAKL